MGLFASLSGADVRLSVHVSGGLEVRHRKFIDDGTYYRHGPDEHGNLPSLDERLERMSIGGPDGPRLSESARWGRILGHEAAIVPRYPRTASRRARDLL